MSKYILYFETLEDSEGVTIEAPFSGYVNNLNVGILSLKNGTISNGEVFEHRIYYTSSDNNVITPYKTDGFGASIISNTYDNVGILDFDGLVTSIGELAFAGCKSLISIVIPDSVTSIGNGVFQRCSSLTSITIPESVTSIGRYAFYDCTSLTSITIPNSVTSIGYHAFIYCSGLTSPIYNAHCFAYMPTSYSGAYAIQDGIKQIAGGAFSTCSSLTSITIPDSVTSIGYEAFIYCSSLTSITISNSVTSIESSAFRDCSSLTSFTIPNSVKSIGSAAFYNCSSLASITCLATTPPALDSYNNLSNVTEVYVPAESVDLYKTATNWSYYSGVIKPIE